MDAIFSKHFYPTFIEFNRDLYDLMIFYTNVGGNGNYNSKGYIECLHHKTELMIKTIRDNMGKIIIWTDTDIRFFSSIDLKQCFGDFTVLTESVDYLNFNPAFCRISCNEKMLNFFIKLLESCKHNNTHDMSIINEYSETIPNIDIETFDLRYKQFTTMPRVNLDCNICNNNQGSYSCLHQLSNLDTIDNKNTILYHSNFTYPNDNKKSMELKLEQLDYFLR